MPANKIKPGDRFGRLTVIRMDHIDERHNRCWLCQCDCGKTCVARGSNLTYGQTQSCGCLRKEIQRKITWMHCTENLNLKGFERYHTNLGIIANPKLPVNNTSGHKGVCLNRHTNKWMAYIDFQSKRYYLGNFTDYDKAVAAREAAEKRYHGPVLEDLKKK